MNIGKALTWDEKEGTTYEKIKNIFYINAKCVDINEKKKLGSNNKQEKWSF